VKTTHPHLCNGLYTRWKKIPSRHIFEYTKNILTNYIIIISLRIGEIIVKKISYKRHSKFYIHVLTTKK